MKDVQRETRSRLWQEHEDFVYVSSRQHGAVDSRFSELLSSLLVCMLLPKCRDRSG